LSSTTYRSEPPRYFAQNVTADWRDVSLPLKGVCESAARSTTGCLIFSFITVISLAGVIFGTSTQSLQGVWQEVCPAPKPTTSTDEAASATTSAARPSLGSPALPTVGLKRQATTALAIPVARASPREKMRGMCCLFFSYLLAIFVLIYVENEAHLADQPGLQAADWPRRAEAWGCPGPESATEGAAWRRIWPS